MIFVNVQVAKGMDEFARLAAQDLGNDRRKERIACDIEWHAKKYVGTSLIELQAHFAVLNIDLIHIVADRKARALARLCHAVQIFGIPRSHQRVMRIGVFAQFINYPTQLVDSATVLGGPAAPKLAINMWQLAMFAGKCGIASDFCYELVFS